MLHKAWNSKGEMPYCFPRSSIKFQGHTVQNITDFDPNWAFPDYRPVAAFKSLRWVQRCCYFVDLWSYFKSFGIMNYALFWYACTARGISTNHGRLICCGTVSVTGQDGGCKQCGQTATIQLKTLFMSRLAVCSHDLHWHWINWTLLCDTMEVSMLRLVCLPIAQHVFQPALTGMLELISRKIDSCEWEQRLSRWADVTKIVSRELDAKFGI